MTLTAPAPFEAAKVHTGFWTDWNYGHVLGARVTMTSRSANLLIAFIAVFDGFIGGFAWCILSFLVHRAMATDVPRDGLHHQIQALLRNTREPFSFARAAVETGWQWRRIVPNAMFRTTSLAVAAVSLAGIFSLAGVFSSQIASSGLVLLTDAACGYYNPPTSVEKNNAYSFAFNQQMSNWAKLSVEYSHNCYVNPLKAESALQKIHFTGSTGTECDLYAQPTLNWTTTLGNPCPFSDPTVCSVPEEEIIRLDTGFLDSNADFGFNLPLTNRLKIRRINTCSPMATDGFSNNSFYISNMSGVLHNVSTYNYGTNALQPWLYPFGEWMEENNITFIYPAANLEADDAPYELLTASFLQSDSFQWIGIYKPDERVSADPYAPVSLFFLANRGYFSTDPVLDPWLHATTSSNVTDWYYDTTYYYNTLPGTVLGCEEQFQICNPNNGLCSDPHSWYYDYISSTTDPQIFYNSSAYASLHLNPTQSALASWLTYYMTQATFTGIVAWIGAEALDAWSQVASAYQFISPSLPQNQWQIEMEQFMAISNAFLQRQLFQSITGPTEADMLPYLTRYDAPTNTSTISHYSPSNSSSQTHFLPLCSSYKIRNSAYTSFSVVGLALNFALGGLILLLGLLVVEILPALQKRRSRTQGTPLDERLAVWIANGVHQLQRRAYEPLHEGVVVWEGGADIPVTRGGAVFRALRIGDEGEGITEGGRKGSVGWGLVKGREGSGRVRRESPSGSDSDSDSRFGSGSGSISDNENENETGDDTIRSADFAPPTGTTANPSPDGTITTTNTDKKSRWFGLDLGLGLSPFPSTRKLPTTTTTNTTNKAPKSQSKSGGAESEIIELSTVETAYLGATREDPVTRGQDPFADDDDGEDEARDKAKKWGTGWSFGGGL